MYYLLIDKEEIKMVTITTEPKMIKKTMIDNILASLAIITKDPKK